MLKFHICALFLAIASGVSCQDAAAVKTLMAVNAGGKSFTDSNAVHFNEVHTNFHMDKFTRKVVGATTRDQNLYQTTFYDPVMKFDLPTTGNGDYKLILKFAEDGTQRVMDVFLNEEHQVVQALDVEAMVGAYTAYDKYISFTVYENQLIWNNEKSAIVDNTVELKIQARNARNAQIAGFVLEKSDRINDPALDALNFQMGLLQRIMATINNHKTMTYTGTFIGNHGQEAQ
jgi:Malectin domain